MSDSDSTADHAKRTPVVKKRLGNVSVAVFVRQVTKSDDSQVPVFDFVLQRSWKDKSDAWQNQSLTLDAKHILPAIESLRAAYVETYGSAPSDEPA